MLWPYPESCLCIKTRRLGFLIYSVRDQRRQQMPRVIDVLRGPPVQVTRKQSKLRVGFI